MNQAIHMNGYYDNNGGWHRSKYCIKPCLHCDCGPPGGLYYNAEYDRRLTAPPKSDVVRHEVGPSPTSFDFITQDHAMKVCKLGEGPDCCRYLTRSIKGWSCEKLSPNAAYFDKRVAEGTFQAQGDNCPGKISL